ncbi:DNA internalization-related competence protein ComEC/Rec2 [Cytobacillus suaedae]|nr:DNA internalization-related competence protein ComEC/Rec2 [Cytobacillus suaedae]
MLVLYFLYLHFRGPKIVVIAASICVVFFTIYFELYDEYNSTKLDGSETNLTFKIATAPNLNGRTFSTVGKVGKERIILRYTIQTKTEKNELTSLKVGMICRIEGKLLIPNKARNFNSFDYQKYLYYKKIYWIFSPTSLTLQNCTQQPPTPYDRLLLMREHGNNYIEKHFPKEAVGIAQALIYGERGYIDDEVLTSYQSLGLVHLLAISGLHVGLLTGAIFYIGIRMGFTRESVTHTLLCLLPIYTILAGAAPSVIRAALMLMILLSCFKWKKVYPIDSIGMACFLMVLFNPYHVFEVGFQLSFMVSLGLILSSKTIILRSTNPLSQTLTVTVIAQLFSFPIIIFYFYEVSLLSIPYNLLFVPVYSFIILPLSILSLLLHILFEPIGLSLMFLLKIILNVLNQFALYGTKVSSLSLTLGKPHILFLVGYFILILTVFKMWERSNKKQIVVSVFLFITLCVVDLNEKMLDPYGTITFIDVGQGDSILIELPFNKGTYLIDTGPKTLNFAAEEWEKKRRMFDTGEDILLPYLKSVGIRKLDKLIITHGDLDHIGNAELLIQELSVDELILGTGPIEKEYEQQLVRIAYEMGIPISTFSAGDVWKSGDNTFYVLAPTGNEQTSNDRSIVIYSEIGGLRWLFTGDLGEVGESKLTSSFRSLPVDVLKVGHHGSNSSTSVQFLEHIKPKVSIISVGVNNRYNHPNPEVVERLLKEESIILRTDLHGAIQYKFRGKSGTFKWVLPYNKTILKPN